MTPTHWAVTDPPVACVAFHGRGEEAVSEWARAVAFEALVWIVQAPSRLDACDRVLVDQFARIGESLMGDPPEVMLAAMADPRCRAWLAALRRAIDQDRRSPAVVDGLLAQAPIVFLGQIARSAGTRPGGRPGGPRGRDCWRAALPAGARLSPVGAEVVLDGPATDLRIHVADQVITVATEAGGVSFSWDQTGVRALPGRTAGLACRPRVFAPAGRGADPELLDAAAFAELDASRGPGDTASPLTPDEIGSRLRDAYDLLSQLWPQALPDLQSRFRALLPMRTCDGRWRNATTGDLPLTIQLTLADQAHPLELAEAIVHEAAHVKLDELLVFGPLLENGPERVVRHPWRPDLRPMIGVLLGAHAFANVLRLYESALLAGVGDQQAVLDQVVQRQAEVAQALSLLDSGARFTPTGALLRDELCAGVLGG